MDLLERFPCVIRHGSKDSIDKDFYIVLNNPIYDKREAKLLCDSFEKLGMNSNLLYIENNKVVWTYKGTVDECNNSIIATFGLHEQIVENPNLVRAERIHGLKVVRTIRGLLSMLSRTEFRSDVKRLLVADNIVEKINFLEKVDLEKINDFKKGQSTVDVLKFFAFQLGQTLALIQDDVELFTKGDVASHYPSLKSFLYRVEGSNVKDLNNMFNEYFCSIVKNHLVDNAENHKNGCFEFIRNDGVVESIDVKKECLVEKKNSRNKNTYYI